MPGPAGIEGPSGKQGSMGDAVPRQKVSELSQIVGNLISAKELLGGMVNTYPPPRCKLGLELLIL